VLRKIVDFFVFSSLYVAICAMLMIWQTSRLLLDMSPPGRLLGFVFFSTMCSYNFHWYLTPLRQPLPPRTMDAPSQDLAFCPVPDRRVGAIVYFFYLTLLSRPLVSPPC
jgi:hypothetical protein